LTQRIVQPRASSSRSSAILVVHRGDANQPPHAVERFCLFVGDSLV